MSCDPISLAGDGCWNCLTPDQKLTAELKMLCLILQALDPMADCDPLTLAGDGCANCLMPGQKQTAIYMVLCSVYESLGSLVGGGILSGNGSPEGVVTATVPAVYLQLDAPGVIWMKVSGVGNTGWAVNS